MASSALASPAIDASPSEQADWLEFEAFFSPFDQARIDEIISSLKIQQGEANDNIGEEDAIGDRLREGIENEINRRGLALGETYPFFLSEDGETLQIKGRADRKATSFYLLCLVLSHVTRSPILRILPDEADVRDVRRAHFQIFSTLAVSGHVNGPALSLGWPRESGETILEVVNRGCNGSGTGKARAKPASSANPAAKDGGIDVLAWRPLDRPPPDVFWLAQAASGHGWAIKSSRDEAEGFLESYYDENPQCNFAYVTICPFDISPEDMVMSSRRHGTILDRTRAPRAALNGLELAAGGVDVDEVGRAKILSFWLSKYQRTVRAAA